MLNVLYDECNPNNSYDEKWYSLSTYISSDINNNKDEVDKEIILHEGYSYELYSHINQSMKTLKYFISDTAEHDIFYTWASDVTESEAEIIKNAYVNSMLMWNNVYYYSYNENGYQKNRVINLIEATNIDDAEIVIYPISSNEYAAKTQMFDKNLIQELDSDLDYDNDINNYSHQHCLKWKMQVNVVSFNPSSFSTKEKKLLAMDRQKRTGAHEMGHILGLGDLDIECGAMMNSGFHHEEILLGYGEPYKTYVTYKDIAGISITRGFHTDNDHIWMKRNNDDSTIDLICALCNGVRFDVELDVDGKYEGKTVNMYKECCHYNSDITSTNMLLVATDGVRDFFKCLNCRHIEEVSSEVDVNLISSFTSEVFQNELEAESYIYYKIKSPYGNGYNFSLSSLNSISLELLDDNLNIVDSASNLTNVNFSKYLDYGVYYIKIKNNSSISNSYTFEISEHTHTYTYETDENNINNHIRTCTTCGYKSSVSHSNSNHYCIYCNAYTNTHDFGAPYTWLNIYNHQATCCCGETTTQAHAVKSGTTKCLLCGGNAGSGIVQMNVMSNGVRFVSAKGSFITNEGIIVLVEEDIEAYLNNELEFYINNTSTK